MKAYLVLVHKNPSHLNRLIHALNDGKSSFFVHIDKSTNISLFDDVKLCGNHITFLRREKTSWASYELVKAILHGLQAVRDSGLPFNHVILLSGQDYPIKSNAFINKFVQEHAGKTFIEYSRLPNHVKWQPNGGLYRVNKYYLGLKPHQRFMSKALNFLSSHTVFPKRRLYKGMTPYAGSMWWIMSMRAVNYVFDFVKKHPGYVDFHQYTFAPDEVFFHTILLNATDKDIADNIVNSDMRFIKWKNISSSHPEMLNQGHIPELTVSTALFARKFDTHRDSEVLDIIDNHRLI